MRLERRIQAEHQEALAALEQALHQHIELENDILFPRALAG